MALTKYEGKTLYQQTTKRRSVESFMKLGIVPMEPGVNSCIWKQGNIIFFNNIMILICKKCENFLKKALFFFKLIFFV